MLRFVRDRYYAGCDRENAPYSQPACFPVEGDWSFLQAADYARRNISTESVVFTGKESSFHYHSGLKTVNANALLKEDSTTLAQVLRDRGVEWVVVSNAGPFRWHMGVLVASACKDFDLVKQFDSRTMVLRVRRPGPSSPGPACTALATWRSEAGTPRRERGVAEWQTTPTRLYGP